MLGREFQVCPRLGGSAMDVRILTALGIVQRYLGNHAPAHQLVLRPIHGSAR